VVTQLHTQLPWWLRARPWSPGQARGRCASSSSPGEISTQLLDDFQYVKRFYFRTISQWQRFQPSSSSKWSQILSSPSSRLVGQREVPVGLLQRLEDYPLIIHSPLAVDWLSNRILEVVAEGWDMILRGVQFHKQERERVQKHGMELPFLRLVEGSFHGPERKLH